MHELSIANAILDAVRKERELLNGARVIKVGVRIGALAGVDPEALSFGFEVLVKDTDLDHCWRSKLNPPCAATSASTVSTYSRWSITRWIAQPAARRKHAALAEMNWSWLIWRWKRHEPHAARKESP
jgi:hypothetical protein